MKKNAPNISLVIPAYNNEMTIINQVKDCFRILEKYCDNYEVIVCDDKSTDNTRLLLMKNFKENKHFILLCNKKNRGIAANMRILYGKAQYTYTFFYSADGDWRTKDVEGMINHLMKTNADIVIGKRVKKVGYNFYRNMISYFHNLLPLLFFGVNTLDAGGIKLFRTELYSPKFISESQFIEAEMIIRAVKKGYKIVSYPVSYHKYVPGFGLGAKFSSVYESLNDLIRLRMQKF